MKRRLALMLAAAFACSVHAQAPAMKIAITSLVADTLTVTTSRGHTGTNVGNVVNTVKMPGPALDLAVMQALDDAIRNAAPGSTVAMLKVPASGSGMDPARIAADGRVAPDHPLVTALKEQGFTHLLLATRHRNNNVVRLREGAIDAGKGQLEGLGYYIDAGLRVQNQRTGELMEGIVAPYLYVQLRLVDLATLDSRTQAITANNVIASRMSDDPWAALTPAEKMAALQSLIRESIPPAVKALVETR